MENEEKRNKKIAIIIGIITLIVFCVGITYAYFTARVRGNEEASTTRVTVGKLIIDFETTDRINNTNGQLIRTEDSTLTNEEKELRKQTADHTSFTVKHNVESKNSADYMLSLTELEISENLKNADFKWELVKVENPGDLSGQIITSGDFSTVGNSTTLNLTNDNYIRLEKNQIDNYVFRIWLEETDEDQSNLSEGSFTAKVALVSRSV